MFEQMPSYQMLEIEPIATRVPINMKMLRHLNVLINLHCNILFI